ncbi:MAG: NAD(P)H-dependent oxidoreductase subunit E [Fimbriimonadia bacterium]|jgi:NADH-quinone oxidoreductase subunit E
MSDLLQLTGRRPLPPKPDEVELRFSARAVAELDRLLTHYPDKKSAILPTLWIAQREYGGHLTPGALAEVAVRLNRPFAEIEGVATFYSMYEFHPVGKHLIEVCTCLTCHQKGAYRILDYLKQKLGIDLGGTTEDGMFSLKEVECLNACDRAPLLQVGSSYYGPVDEAKIDALLTDLRKKEDSSVVQLANDIVQCHLTVSERREVGEVG